MDKIGGAGVASGDGIRIINASHRSFRGRRIIQSRIAAAAAEQESGDPFLRVDAHDVAFSIDGGRRTGRGADWFDGVGSVPVAEESVLDISFVYVY